MIPMTMIGKVRRMFHRQNKLVREIARLTSLSRNTISKYLNMDVQEEPKYQRRSQPTRLTPFHEVLVQALSVDARRPKKERLILRGRVVVNSESTVEPVAAPTGCCWKSRSRFTNSASRWDL